jgi:hypothetical protein
LLRRDNFAVNTRKFSVNTISLPRALSTKFEIWLWLISTGIPCIGTTSAFELLHTSQHFLHVLIGAFLLRDSDLQL